MVVQENEVILALIGAGALVFMLANRRRLERLPAWPLFLASFVSLLAGWLFTLLEGLIWGDLFNLLEHLHYMASAVLMAVWCWRVFGRPEAG